jgi:uncharacterized protein (TIGR03067 family)
MNASFRPIHFVALLLVASGSLRADENAVHLKANKSELAKLQGSWTIVSFSQANHEFEARRLDEISKFGLVFEIKDDALTVTTNGRVVSNMNAILRLDANYNPKLLDFAKSVKAFNDGEGVFEGVYSLDGDSLLWCVNVEDDHPVKGRRPTAVESKPDSSAIVVRFARRKD